MSARAPDVDFDEFIKIGVFRYVYRFGSGTFRADKCRHLLAGNIHFFRHFSGHYSSAR